MEITNTDNSLSNTKQFTDKYIETNDHVKLYIKDYGTGKPVILIHGWPLSNEMWEYQIENLVANNYRVIAYDRRGFGKSSQPWHGYDYDTLTDDLHAIITQLELKNITLVGFSMGGGEVIRYLSRYGSDYVSKAVLVSSIIPYLAHSNDNLDGRTPQQNEATQNAIKKDRIGFIHDFGKNFFGVNFITNVISTPLLEYYRMLASLASPHATLACALSLSNTDFRDELKKVTIPTLIIHGDNDKIVPKEISSDKTVKLITTNKYIVYEDAPHGLFYTNKDQLNSDLLLFLNS